MPFSSQFSLLCGRDPMELIVTEVTSATHSVLTTDEIINVAYTATGAVTITFPTASITAGSRIWYIVDTGGNAGSNFITIDTGGAEKISGENTAQIKDDYGSALIQSDGSNLFIM